MVRVVFACCFVLTFVRESPGLRIAGVSVPRLRQRGESASLGCEYELEGGRLYSVKWYKEHEEFYRYMPRLAPPQLAHKLDGVTVVDCACYRLAVHTHALTCPNWFVQACSQLEKSSARRVHLRNLTLRSRGLYRCEVSEEAPSFHSAQAEAPMDVYYFPHEGPRISGHDRRYRPGESLDVNCSSAGAFPAPHLQWLVDGQKVTDQSVLIEYEARLAAQGLLVSTLGLKAPVRRRMRLRCVASIGSHRRERTVLLEVSSSYRHKPPNLHFVLTFTIYFLCVTVKIT